MDELLPVTRSSGCQQDKISIILADDHPLLRRALRDVLEEQADFQVIAEAGDGEEAVRLVLEYYPDIVIMDISMPRVNGLDAIRQIKTERPDTIILVLTVHDESEHILGMLEAGASGYLTKGVFDEEIVHAIRSILAGDTVLSSSVSQQILRYALRHAAKPVTCDKVDILTSRELEILNLVAKGMKNKDVAEELNLGLPTIKAYMSDIFTKLKVDSRTKAIMIGLQRGIITVDDAE